MLNSEARTILVDDNWTESVPSTIGTAIGDASITVQGRLKQAVDRVRDFTAEQPFTAVLAALSLGAVVGFLTARR